MDYNTLSLKNEERDYKALYQKYKNKYLNLKEQLAGTYGIGSGGRGRGRGRGGTGGRGRSGTEGRGRGRGRGIVYNQNPPDTDDRRLLRQISDHTPITLTIDNNDYYFWNVQESRFSNSQYNSLFNFKLSKRKREDLIIKKNNLINGDLTLDERQRGLILFNPADRDQLNLFNQDIMLPAERNNSKLQKIVEDSQDKRILFLCEVDQELLELISNELDEPNGRLNRFNIISGSRFNVRYQEGVNQINLPSGANTLILYSKDIEVIDNGIITFSKNIKIAEDKFAAEMFGLVNNDQNREYIKNNFTNAQSIKNNAYWIIVNDELFVFAHYQSDDHNSDFNLRNEIQQIIENKTIQKIIIGGDFNLPREVVQESILIPDFNLDRYASSIRPIGDLNNYSKLNRIIDHVFVLTRNQI